MREQSEVTQIELISGQGDASGRSVLRPSRPVLTPPPDFFTLHQGDARRIDALLAPYSNADMPLLTTTITSPPYGDIKDYGHRDQIGWGQSYDEYLAEMLRIFRAIARHTRDDGSMWIVADTLRPEESGSNGVSCVEPLPFHLVDEAKHAGWILRDVIIWKKDRTLPWSGRGRLRNAFEYVLFFVRTGRYKYHVDRIRDPIRLEEWWVKYPERYNPGGKVPENVWDIPIPVQGSWAGGTGVQHACPLPIGLVERLILLSTDAGDVVFDPFAGSGPVVAGADALDRRGLGIELVKRHVRMFQGRMKAEVTRRIAVDELPAREQRATWLQDIVLKLRVLKYPRVLMTGVARTRSDLPRPVLAAALMQVPTTSTKNEPFKVVDAQTIVVVDGDRHIRQDMQTALEDVSRRKPASKFGIRGPISVVSRRQFMGIVGQTTFYAYPNGRTYMSDGPVTIADAFKRADESTASRYPLIVGNVEVKEQPRRLG